MNNSFLNTFLRGIKLIEAIKNRFGNFVGAQFSSELEGYFELEYLIASAYQITFTVESEELHRLNEEIQFRISSGLKLPYGNTAIKKNRKFYKINKIETNFVNCVFKDTLRLFSI